MAMKTRETGRLAAGAVVVAAAWFGARRLRGRLSAVPRDREVPCQEQSMFWSLEQRRDG
jgi:hypothetical protein